MRKAQGPDATERERITNRERMRKYRKDPVHRQRLLDITRRLRADPTVRARYNEQVRLRQNARRRVIQHMKVVEGCVRCGVREELVWHHTNPQTKCFCLGNPGGRAWKVIMDEMDKCVVLCDTCHKEAHAKDGSLGRLYP